MSSYTTTKDFLNNSNCDEMLSRPNMLPPIPQSIPPPVTQLIPQSIPQSIPQPQESTCNDLKYILMENENSGNPEVWGPAFLFSLHNCSLRYPENPSPLWKERMKYFILGIPVMLQCEKCADHATSYIESKYKNLDSVVANKDSLFSFFCEFHNFVNKRLNKKEIPVSEAYKLYTNNFNVTKLKMN